MASRSSMELMYDRQDSGTRVHDLPGGSPQGRHHTQPPPGHLRNDVTPDGRPAIRSRSTSAGAGLLFPNPETQFHSTLADQNTTNNVTGFKNARIDELLEQYDGEFDQPKRVAIIREIDGILANEHQWISELGRAVLPHRVLEQVRPSGRRTSRASATTATPLSLWWIDPEKERQLAQARARQRSQDAGGPDGRPLLGGVGQRQQATGTRDGRTRRLSGP